MTKGSQTRLHESEHPTMQKGEVVYGFVIKENGTLHQIFKGRYQGLTIKEVEKEDIPFLQVRVINSNPYELSVPDHVDFLLRDTFIYRELGKWKSNINFIKELELRALEAHYMDISNYFES